MSEYIRAGRAFLPPTALDGLGRFSWRDTTCGGSGDAVPLGAGEVACVTRSDLARARSRGCVAIGTAATRGCAGGGTFHCCPEREQVRGLQQAIAAADCAAEDHTIDGLWGPKTAEGARCFVEREGWEAASSRFPVLRGLVEAPAATPPRTQPPITGQVRHIISQPYGEGAATWTYVAVGAATLVLGFAVAQMWLRRKDEDEEPEREFGRTSLAGSY